MNDKQDDHDNTADHRALVLRQQREDVLLLPAEQALDRIHEAKHPVALVHSFPEEDLYFLIHDLGPEDALSLLALASNRQREYIIDVAAWRRDRLHLQTMTRWLFLMLSADPHRVISWLYTEKSDLLELFLFRNIEVGIREHDQDPSIFGDGFFTYDDVYYVRILDNPFLSEKEALSEGAESRTEDSQRRLFLRKLLALIADEDHFRYQQLLHAATHLLPAEVEEEAYRLRNVRLAEKGFLPFDEAVGIYQSPKADVLKTQPIKSFGADQSEGLLAAVPHYPVKLLQKGSPFVDALQTIESSLGVQQIQTEFASLCNQLISADQKSITDKSHLVPIVKKVCGYLNIGLDVSSTEAPGVEKSVKLQAIASLIQRVPLVNIFQLGYSRALKLKWQAQRWRKTAWFENNGLPLTFWGEAWLGVLGGLLLEKPLCYDNYQTGETLYREFSSLQDIKEAQVVLDQIIAMDALLAQMAPICQQGEDHLLTYQNLILTLFARHESSAVSDTKSEVLNTLSPLSLDEFETFFHRLFGYDKETPSPPKKTTHEVKTAFLNWLSKQSEAPAADITKRLGSTLDNLFEDVDAELGAISPNDLDPRFINLVWIS
jgi:uncharacterized protein DUF6178